MMPWLAFFVFALFGLATVGSAGAKPPGGPVTGPIGPAGERPVVNERLPPQRPTTEAQKRQALQRLGVTAELTQFGVPFRLDMLTPSVAGHGWLHVAYPIVTIHRPGGYAVAHLPARRIEGQTTLKPAVSLMLRSDYQNHQLIDCQIYQPPGTQTWLMDFRQPNTPGLWYAPPITVQANTPYAISHLFYVVQKLKPGEGPIGGAERQIELSASDGQPANANWSFLNCEITPFS